MNNKKKGLILSIIGILGLIVITVGVTYAFFNYVKEGTTENSITSGTITFLYTEVSEVGRGIRIEDAYPMSDEIGKVQVGEGKVFDFKITSNTSDSISIPYEVTARKKSTSTSAEEAVKLYLTEVDGNLEEEILLDNYSNLVQTTKVDSSRYIEKTIYEGKVPVNSINYEKNFRLRMWIDENTDFGPIKGENGEDIYPYNGKEFTITVNVYANGKVVTDKDSVIKPPTLNKVSENPVLTNLGVSLKCSIISEPNITSYYSFDSGETWQKYQEDFFAPLGEIYLKNVDNVTGEESEIISTSITPDYSQLPEDTLPYAAYDNDNSTLIGGSASGGSYFHYLDVDSSAWGSTITANFGRSYDAYCAAWINLLDSNNNTLLELANSCANVIISKTIPENTVKLRYDAQLNGHLYDLTIEK